MPGSADEVTPGNLCPLSGHVSSGVTWKKREDSRKVRLVWETQATGM